MFKRETFHDALDILFFGVMLSVDSYGLMELFTTMLQKVHSGRWGRFPISELVSF